MMDKVFKESVLKIKENNPNMDYIDCMIEKFEEYLSENQKSSDFLNILENIDERCLLVRLFGNYHYQVNNGGHYQYFDNGYASTENIDKGCFSKKVIDCDIHKEMIALVEKYFPTNTYTTYFINILSTFLTTIQEVDCEMCGGNGFIEEEVDCEMCGGNGFVEEDCECLDCHGEGTIKDESECWMCHGEGSIKDDYEVVDSDFIDKQYYEIEDKILQIFNQVIYEWLTTNDNVQSN